MSSIKECHDIQQFPFPLHIMMDKQNVNYTKNIYQKQKSLSIILQVNLYNCYKYKTDFQEKGPSWAG